MEGHDLLEVIDLEDNKVTFNIDLNFFWECILFCFSINPVPWNLKQWILKYCKKGILEKMPFSFGVLLQYHMLISSVFLKLYLTSLGLLLCKTSVIFSACVHRFPLVRYDRGEYWWVFFSAWLFLRIFTYITVFLLSGGFANISQPDFMTTGSSELSSGKFL